LHNFRRIPFRWIDERRVDSEHDDHLQGRY
jgi:hypothetical protein